MRRTTRFMAVALVALLAVILMGAKLPGVTPAPGENKPQQRVNLTSRQSAGVYYVADSYGLQNIYLIHGGSLAGTLYMCNETDADSDGDGSVDTAAECVSLGSVGADLTLEGRKGTRRFIVIDIDTAEADGTPSKLTIFGTNDQVASGGGSTTDIDGDGLYDVVRFPADFDGDGSSWLTCTGEGEPDAACPFAGPKVWTDFASDFHAAQDKSNVGVSMFFDPGLYVTRVAVCDGGTRDELSCSSDADCTGGGTCDVLPTSGYDFQHTYPSGALRSSVATTRTAHAPVAWKSGMKMFGAGADLNSAVDDAVTGSWIVDDLGYAAETDGSDPGVDLSDWSFGVGFKDTDCGDDTAYGECLYDDTPVTGLVSGLEGNAEDSLLCICDNSAASGGCTGAGVEPNVDDAWAAALQSGDWLIFDGMSYTDNANTNENNPIVRVIVEGEGCDSGNGVLVRAHDGSFDTGASLAGIDVRRVDPRMIATGIEVTGFNFVPQNPLQQNGYGADWPLADDCGDFDDGQDGSANGDSNRFSGVAATADRADFDPDCDLNSSVGIFSGYGHRVWGNAFHHSSAVDGPGTMDGADSCIDCSFDNNYLGPTSAVSSMLDTGTGWEISENIFEGCAEIETSTGSCFRTLGDNVEFFRNRFFNVGVGRCTDTDDATTAASTELCHDNNDCSGTCSISPGNWGAARNGLNRFEQNFFTGFVSRFGLDASGSDFIFTDNTVTGVSGDIPIFIAVDPTNDDLRDVQIRDNTFRFMRTRGTNNAWVTLIQDTNQIPRSVQVTGNRFIASEAADGDSNQLAALRIGSGSSENSAHAEYEISGNVVYGYDVLAYTEITAGELEEPLPPGWRRNVFNDVMLTERGGDTYANVISGITCDASTKGDAYTITDSSSCTTDNAGTDAQCYCDGSSWTDRP